MKLCHFPNASFQFQLTLSKKMQKGGYGFLYFQWFHWVRPHRGHTQKGPPMKSPHVVRRNNALTDEPFSILQ
jgi:hypothetical protein